MRLNVKDYAFWSDAYRYLHLHVDEDWAYTRGNVGATLYQDFGFQGVFVVNDADRTVYAVVEGEQQPFEISEWLDQPLTALLEQARAGVENETSVSTLINVRGNPALVAAAAITPGTDPTVVADERRASVLVFVNILDGAKLGVIGDDFGVANLHIATAADIAKGVSSLPRRQRQRGQPVLAAGAARQAFDGRRPARCWAWRRCWCA